MAESSIDMVRAFHEKFALTDHCTDMPGIPSLQTCMVRLQGLQEEVAELNRAMANGDIVECLDALTDIQYFLDGTYLALGLAEVKHAAFAEVHTSNMTKSGSEASGRITKGPHFQPPNLKKIINTYIEEKKCCQYDAMDTIAHARQTLHHLADKKKATCAQRFFKTGPGQYGEGDIFLGVRVPDIRKIAKQYAHLPEKALHLLIQSPIHEERLLALLILVVQFQKGTAATQENIFRFYMAHRLHVNNWDLVDLSADKIAGAYLLHRDKHILYQMTPSNSLWERRIAIISTFHFIKHNHFSDTLEIAALLLHDTHDLIHKAVGWMLREIGKRNMAQEQLFLDQHAPIMPRTMLRYAIERFPEPLRQIYLQAKHTETD